MYVPSGHGALEQVVDPAADFKPGGHGVWTLLEQEKPAGHVTEQLLSPLPEKYPSGHLV